MKKFLALILSAICLLIASAANASQCPYQGPCQDHPISNLEPVQKDYFYIGAFGGINWNNNHCDKQKAALLGTLSLGYKFNNGMRMEGEVGGWVRDSKGPGLGAFDNSWSLMANFLYDFDGAFRHLPKLTPYLGGGIGLANGELAGQAIAGISYRITKSISIGTEYRYFAGREYAKGHCLGLTLRKAF